MNMQRILMILAFSLFVGCKETPKSNSDYIDKATETILEKTDNYPEDLNKVFEAHGGLENWKTKRTLSFTMPKESGAETHTIDLYSRKEKIETPKFAMGFDGKDFWLADENEDYKGDPIFYHNLMFYFYAMPFVLADDGINYGETEDLEFEGRVYPGIRISYDQGVGVSHKDEYFLHDDPESYQMAWLGYTVTYRSGEKSENVKWIRYNDWMKTEGLKLPNSMTWHTYEGRTIKDPRDPTTFENIVVSDTPKSETFYAIPENGKVVTKTK